MGGELECGIDAAEAASAEDAVGEGVVGGKDVGLGGERWGEEEG